MSLLALQRGFHRHLVDAPGAIGDWTDAAAPGLEVYHNAYRVQLTECLAAHYPQTHAWLGGPAFLAAMQDHIAVTPPAGWTLGAYGEGFDRTLARRYRDDPEVAELAALEWMLGRCFEAANVTPLSPAEIARIDWDAAALALVPDLATLPVRSNAGAIWSALAAGEAPPAATLLPEPAMLIVWRQGFTPCFRTIEMIEYGALTLASAGVGFAEICAMLVTARGEADGVALAGRMLGSWFADGLVHHILKKEF